MMEVRVNFEIMYVNTWYQNNFARGQPNMECSGLNHGSSLSAS